jgi:hypothetical protein
MTISDDGVGLPEDFDPEQITATAFKVINSWRRRLAASCRSSPASWADLPPVAARSAMAGAKLA